MPTKTIPYARQSISQGDIQAVVRVLQSDWLTQGPTIAKFEERISNFCGCKDAVAVCNATSALHLSCLALNLSPGDYLWTSPISFVASANCGRYCGANVDFVDIDPKTYNISPDALEEKLSKTKDKERPKIVIPVDFAGQPCDMARIYALSQKYGFRIIIDASHAIGSFYKNTPEGKNKFSDLTVFSFHPVKIITTGEGGIITTNDPKIAERLRRLRSHGITRDSEYFSEASHGPWYYEQLELGFNYRMTDIQAALGLSQLRRIKLFVKRRREIAQKYNHHLANLPLILPWEHPDCVSAYHLYVIRVPEGGLKTRKEVFMELRKRRILANVHYIPIHLQPYYRKLGFRSGDFPVAEKFYREAISLPMYYNLSKSEQKLVIQTLQEIFGAKSK